MISVTHEQSVCDRGGKGAFTRPLKKMIQILGLSSGQERKISPQEKLRLLRLNYEAEQAFVETARLKVISFKARIQFVNAAEKTWQERYWLNEKRDLKEIREKQAEVAEDLARLGLVKNLLIRVFRAG